MRYLSKLVLQTIEKEQKMAFIAGPRQVGKTTLSKTLLSPVEGYFNWDIERSRRAILKNPSSFWGASTRIVLDEIHKYPRWKRFLKGLYDDVGKQIQILVTGSGRLDLYQKGGDSLLGRYGLCRLHPFSVGELVRSGTADFYEPDHLVDAILNQDTPAGADEALENILRWSGFPEPLFAESATRLNKWQIRHRDLILREDLRDLSRIRDIGLIDAMISLLPERIGSPLSVNGLREDLNVAFGTAQGWLKTLEHLYFLFEIRPFSGKLARTLQREGKVYLFDFTVIENEGARFENMVALHLKKAVDAWTDCGYGEFNLWYVRDKEKREVDFLITLRKKPFLLMECKLSESEWSPPLLYFHERMRPKWSFQIVRDFPNNLRRHKIPNIIGISADRFLAQLP